MTSRRLTAILAADIAGYSALMGADEEATVRDLKAHQSVLLPIVTEFCGRVVDTAGDGMLVEFPSVLNAVKCALAMQETMASRNAEALPGRAMQYRIGINQGDVVFDDGRIYGDGINVAARLESIAEPGGICISGKVFDEVSDRLNAHFEDWGERELKNIARLTRVFASRPVRTPAEAGRDVLVPSLALPTKPSIAVLPFQNMSGDAEQDYFADGMVEEITTALSRMRWLFVIARNSSFTYKGGAVDVRQVGRELGVRYVLEGSVRKAGDRVRITGQLIDTATAAHLWADRFDGDLANIFDLQDQVTASVVGAIAPKLEQAEIERAKRKPTESLDAYDYFLRGMSAFHQCAKHTHDEALELFYRAIKLDPGFASAYGMAARCYVQSIGYGWVTDRALESAEAARLARRAAELGRDDAVALCSAGLALAAVVGDLDDGAALIDRALVLNPNLAWAWLSSSWSKIYLGEPEAAIERAGRAMRLSPLDPQMFAMQTATAFAHFFACRGDEATSWAETAAREQPNFILSATVSAAAAALAGRFAEAEKAMVRVHQINPTLRLSNLSGLIPLRRPRDVERWSDGLRKAGLPE